MKQIRNSVNFYGCFKPEEFHPAVLLMHGIEKKKLADDVSIHKIGEFVTNFTIGSTNYFMDKNRFQIDSHDKISKIINDKIRNIFSLLPSDLQICGHNLICQMHIELDGKKQWERISKRFAPLSPWGKFGNQMHKSKSEMLDGLSSLKMSASEVLDSFTIIKLATIERSMIFPNTAGIFVCVDFLYKYELYKHLNKSIDLAIDGEKKFAIESNSILETIKDTC